MAERRLPLGMTPRLLSRDGAAVFSTMVRSLINALPLEDLKALVGESQENKEEVR